MATRADNNRLETAYWNQRRGEIVFCYDLVERFVRLAELRECVVGDAIALQDRQPMDSQQIDKCVADLR